MPRDFLPGQRAQLYVYDCVTGTSTLVLETRRILIEAPNWTPDGKHVVVNGGGRLFAFGAPNESGEGASGGRISGPGTPHGKGLSSGNPKVPGDEALVEIELGGVPAINNDHVVSPDGQRVYVSADDAHIYEVPLNGTHGGAGRRVTSDDGTHHYLHGISADGGILSYIGLEHTPDGVRTNVYLLCLGDGMTRQLTDDAFPDDGAEFGPGFDSDSDPSGTGAQGGSGFGLNSSSRGSGDLSAFGTAEWVYFNSERASQGPGRAQLFRMRPDGGDIQRLLTSDRVDWFPHPSPDGRTMAFVSYPAGTLGHPENVSDVRICLLNTDGSGAEKPAPQVRVVATVFGGQGALNVASWAPDSQRFAYVAYTN